VFIADEQSYLFVLTLSRSSIATLRTARQTIGDGLPACIGDTNAGAVQRKDVFPLRKQANACASFSTTLPLADLVVMAGWPHPFPFRTRP
jgi:hypothetical protein